MIRATLQAEYDRLCAQRDAVNLIVEPMQAELTAAIAELEAARIHAESLAEQISAARGGAQWLKLKTEIAILANALAELSRAPE